MSFLAGIGCAPSAYVAILPVAREGLRGTAISRRSLSGFCGICGPLLFPVPPFGNLAGKKCNIQGMKNADKTCVEIYADGACSGNPGVGGFGAILRAGEKEKELSGCEPQTTNNRMEMMAVITALEALKRPCRVSVTTDSSYIVKGMTEWIAGWQKNGWRSSQKKEVMNRDLWERLLQAAAPHEISWIWIKGHNGHIENERCDLLARKGIEKCRGGG